MNSSFPTRRGRMQHDPPRRPRPQEPPLMSAGFGCAACPPPHPPSLPLPLLAAKHHPESLWPPSEHYLQRTDSALGSLFTPQRAIQHDRPIPSTTRHKQQRPCDLRAQLSEWCIQSYLPLDRVDLCNEERGDSAPEAPAPIECRASVSTEAVTPVPQLAMIGLKQVDFRRQQRSRVCPHALSARVFSSCD